jgi:hypothetical protein
MERKRRAESYLGIHFDFHAGYDCKHIGERVDPQMIQAIIDRVKPDYVQCDCKGHRGVASYPTNVGFPAPGFVRDQLRIWREVTAKNGVALFMHFSGVWDTEVVTRYPEYAVVDSMGKPSAKNTSFYSPYVDEFLIPQLKELRDEYGVDGVWVDGECWSVEPDYGDEAAASFRKASGLPSVPATPQERGYSELLDFTRKNFLRYLEHYVDALHEHDEEFQIASNWAFSSQVPQPVSVDVDYISGDYSLNDSVDAARFEARAMMRQDKPWDLMAWSFARDRNKPTEGNHTKSAVQLEQEAAAAIMLGGGFQAYFKQKRDGSINPWTMRVMEEVAAFCREREELCHKAESVPQVALLYAGEAFYRDHPRPFGNWGVDAIRPLTGVLHCLLEGGSSVEVCMSHHLSGRMSEYGLIVVPEWRWLPRGLRDELASYAESGGSLLLIGSSTAKLFANELDLTLAGGPGREEPRFLWFDGHMAPFTARYERFELGERATVAAELYPYNDPEVGEATPGVILSTFGSGKIAATLFPMGRAYLDGASFTARKLLSHLAGELFPDRIARVSGSQFVDVAVMRKGGNLSVNLLNTSGPHGDPGIHTFDEIPPVGPLTVKIKSQSRPSSVRLEPGGRELDWTYENGDMSTTIDRLDIHAVIVLR